MKIAIDLVLVAIILGCVWAGYKKGLIMGIGGMVVIIVSLYGAALLSATFSYEVVPALRPFVTGYMEKQMTGEVLEDMGFKNSDRSVSDILADDPGLKAEFCTVCYESVGIYTDAAEQMAEEALSYAEENDAELDSAVGEVLSARLAYVGCIILGFLLILIILTAIGNIPNLTFKIPNMDKLNDIGGLAMGFIKGVTYCVLLCWALRFMGLIIGEETLRHTILARFFILIDFITLGVGI